MKSIIISGVGGQGVLTASDLLSDVFMKEGYSVKKSEVHGMSQRGGDVISTIKYGREVYSPLPSIRDTEYILSFELLEALRNINYLSESGTIIVNNFIWEPLPVAAGFEEYPGDIIKNLEKHASDVVVIPASDISMELGNIRATNLVLLGVLASKMDISENTWIEIIREKIPPRFIELNIAAFNRGFQFTRENKK
jgi:indolepyruvate ferredoxin oxidoreductase beta subunit